MCSPSIISLGLMLALATEAIAQVDRTSVDHPLHELALLQGTWAGEIGGTMGSSSGERQYRFVIRGRFLFMTHDRTPQDLAIHDDDREEWSIFSFDTERDVIVLREFLVEGIVNTYECEVDARLIALTCAGQETEGATGISLSVRYEFTDLDHFTETFEIVGTDGAVQVRMEGHWTRTGERG